MTRSGARRALITLAVCAAGGLVPPAAPAFGAAGDDAHRHGYPDGPRPAPHCVARVCVHWVDSGADAPSPADADADGLPDEIENAAAELAATYEEQTSADGLGWREPPGDGAVGGGTDRVDVYVKSGPFRGRTWADRDGTGARSQPAYVLLSPRLARDVLRFVAAHEMAHVVQYGYDATAPHWLYEATATWIEHEMVPELDSWQRHLAGWTQQTESTPFGGSKGYGSAVWLHWLAGRHGRSVVREIWEQLGAHPPETGDLAAMDAVLRVHGSRGLHDEYGRFAAALPEWRLPGSGFPRASTLPDVERRDTLAPDAAATRVDQHRGSLMLLDVPAGDARVLRLEATLPDGLPGTIALVGRTGDADTGTAITAQTHLPSGGAASVTLTADRPLTRVTAVFVDADQYTVEHEPPAPTARVVTVAGAKPAEVLAGPQVLVAEPLRIKRQRARASWTARRWTRCRPARSSRRRGRAKPSAPQASRARPGTRPCRSRESRRPPPACPARRPCRPRRRPPGPCR